MSQLSVLMCRAIVSNQYTEVISSGRTSAKRTWYILISKVNFKNRPHLTVARNWSVWLRYITILFKKPHIVLECSPFPFAQLCHHIPEAKKILQRRSPPNPYTLSPSASIECCKVLYVFDDEALRLFWLLLVLSYCPPSLLVFSNTAVRTQLL